MILEKKEEKEKGEKSGNRTLGPVSILIIFFVKVYRGKCKPRVLKFEL